LAGVIVQTGEDVRNFKVGDAVLGFTHNRGSHAEFVAVPVGSRGDDSVCGDRSRRAFGRRNRRGGRAPRRAPMTRLPIMIPPINQITLPPKTNTPSEATFDAK
jgi:NADPH:quinone reductase-like Zn-dependent oxidoreductase